MEPNEEAFSSPMRNYVAQQLQLSFDFVEMRREINTFEVSKAEYEVRVAECYLTEAEAVKDKVTLNKSQQLRGLSGGPTGLFRSSSWFEVYHIKDKKLSESVDNEEVHTGDANETAAFLIKLDREGNHFSYCNTNWFEEPEILEGHVQKYRSLHDGEKHVLDLLIREKLNALYRT